jgi:hypothetical protein
MLTSTTSRNPLSARAQIKDARLADVYLLATGTKYRRPYRFALEHGPLNLYRAKALRRKMSVSREAKQRQQFVALEIIAARIFEHSAPF